MPKYAEIIFETGAKSLLVYENESEVEAFVREHHRRAISGEPGATQDQVLRADLGPEDFAVMPSIDQMKSRPAERVSKVYLYNEHPGDTYDSRVSVDTVKTLIDGMAGDGNTINHEQLVAALRDEASPVHIQDQGRLESFYKVDADGELDLAFLKDVE